MNVGTASTQCMHVLVHVYVHCRYFSHFPSLAQLVCTCNAECMELRLHTCTLYIVHCHVCVISTFPCTCTVVVKEKFPFRLHCTENGKKPGIKTLTQTANKQVYKTANRSTIICDHTYMYLVL